MKSELIALAYYDEQTTNLTLKLRDGSRREFASVPREVVDSLAAAPSPGRFYLEKIKPFFPKVSEGKPVYPRSTRWLFAYH